MANSYKESKWFSEPLGDVVGVDWQGNDIYDGDYVFISPDRDLIPEDTVDDYMREYAKEHFEHGYLCKGGFEYD